MPPKHLSVDIKKITVYQHNRYLGKIFLFNQNQLDLLSKNVKI